MKQNEVVERLKHLLTEMEIENKKDIKTLDESAFDNTIKNALKQNEESLTEAIRCVELVPELIEALEEAREFFIDDGDDCNYWEDEVRKYGALIKKAKGEE